MKTWNVIVSLPVEIEMQVEAEGEDEAKVRVSGLVDEFPINCVRDALYASTTGSCEVIEAYELEETNAT